jgi:hypothetical protein
LSGVLVRWKAGKSAGESVGVLQAAVNSTVPRHNSLADSFADPPMIEITLVHLPELRFMRHSLLSPRGAPQI